jgi:RNA polymerase sigma-70 factor (ECF subfamily)
MKVYDRLYPRIYLSAYYIIGNKMDAEDIAQDAFLKAFKKISSLKKAESLDSWISTIARNKALELMRKKPTVVLDDDIPLEDAGETDWAQFGIQDILKAIMLLPDGYRKVMSMYLLDGLNHEQIALELGIARSASRSHYSRGKRKLIQILENQ